MVRHRMKYFGDNDLGNFVFWEESLSYMDENMKAFHPKNLDLNDIIELYNIGEGYKHLKADYKSKCTNNYLWLSKANQLSKRYFNSFPVDKMLREYSMLELDYIKDFWILFQNCKVYNKITHDQFIEICNEPRKKHVTLRAVLVYSKLVKEYEKELLKILDNYPLTWQILCEQYELGKGKYYLPTQFKKDNWDKYIERYLNQSDMKHNPNTLNLIVSADFPVSPKIKSEAKKKYGQYIKKIENDVNNDYFSIEVMFTSLQSEPYKITLNGLNASYSYNADILKANLTNENILNNFIYLFCFLDKFDRITTISHMHEMSVFEQMIRLKAASHYEKGWRFDFKSWTFLIHIDAYERFLNEQGCSIEDAIQHFYNISLSNDFQIEGFKIDLQATNSSYNMLSQNLVHCIEGVINQYKCYVRLGKVDWDYVEMAEEPADYRKIPSKISNKYFYVNSKDCEDISGWLFSDQTTLGHIERKSISERNLYDIINRYDIGLEDYEGFQQGTIDLLIDKGILFINSDGYLKFKNPLEIRLLKDLYDNDFGETVFLNGKLWQDALKNLSEKHMIRYGSTLLSENEGEYFNYYLNTISSSNGPQLRNLYSHGKAFGLSEEEHKRNYFILLRLLILLTLKIRNELIAVIDRRMGNGENPIIG